jgi:GT2 family glycosyltransferase
MPPRVAIVYLCYNGRPYLEQVFFSLERLDYPKDRLEIIAVDNASSDGSAEWLRGRGGITFLPLSENTGFAGGNNVGMERAMLGGADYIFLLNNDAKLHPAAIREAVAMAESDPKIGSAQSLIRLWQDEDVLNATGGQVHFLGFGFVRDNGVRAGAEDVAPLDGTEIAYASGAAVLYRTAALREAGLLEPFYFMYHDDLELGWRLRLAGWRNVIAVRSVAYHHYEFHRSIQKYFWMERARLLVLLSHLKPATLVLLSPFLLGLEFALLCFAAKGGWLKDKTLAYLDLLRPRTWKHVAEKRRASALMRSVPDREIVRLWTGRIEHQESNDPVVERLGNPALNAVWFVLKKVIVW